MRILTIASGGYSSNGALLASIASAAGLAHRGHDVTMLTPEGGYVDRHINRDVVPVIHSSLSRWPLSELRRIRDWIVDHEIDVIHTHSSRASAFGAILRRVYRVPTVATAHAMKIQLHWCCNDHVIAVSDATRRFHICRNLVAPWKITTALNTVDTNRFQPISSTHRDAIRASLGLDPQSPVLGIVGNIIPRKGHCDAVMAIAKIRYQFPGAVLVIVGQGTDAEIDRVRRIAVAAGVDDAVIWTGYRDDVAVLLGAFDLLVSPSLNEPFGLIAPESLACEVPVIATRTGGFLTTVQDGQTGFLISKRSPEQIAVAAIQLLRNPSLRRSFGIQGRQWVMEHLSVDQHFKTVETILSNVARRHVRRTEATTPVRQSA